MAARRGDRGPSLPISEDAVPHLAHQGPIVAVGQAGAGRLRSEAIDWCESTQTAELLDLPGVLATVRFEPETGPGDPSILHLILCGGPVGEVMHHLGRMRLRQQLTGRFPAHRGVYETLALLPYQSVTPLDYGFLDDEHEVA